MIVPLKNFFLEVLVVFLGCLHRHILVEFLEIWTFFKFFFGLCLILFVSVWLVSGTEYGFMWLGIAILK